jgi:outer membrane immunogenic protein
MGTPPTFEEKDVNQVKTIRVPTLAALAACTLAACPAVGAERGSIKDVSAQRAPAIWQGLYLGLTAGAAGAGVDVDKFGKKDDLDLEDTRFAVAPVIGYNFSNGPWIWGVEADFSSSGFEQKKTIAGLGTLQASSDWFGSVRLRGGYAFNQVLVYGTAGLAFADFDIKSSLGGKSSSTATGFAFGLGAEYAIDQNWAARIEGIAYTFDEDIKLAGATRSVDMVHSTIRAGITRRF